LFGKRETRLIQRFDVRDGEETSERKKKTVYIREGHYRQRYRILGSVKKKVNVLLIRKKKGERKFLGGIPEERLGCPPETYESN